MCNALPPPPPVYKDLFENSSSVVFIKNVKTIFLESLVPSNSFDKPWVTESNIEGSSTLDISALTSQPQDQALDSLESQMAALHGATGANTPWHSFQSSDYY